jgi:hypothetical protein
MNTNLKIEFVLYYKNMILLTSIIKKTVCSDIKSGETR